MKVKMKKYIALALLLSCYTNFATAGEQPKYQRITGENLQKVYSGQTMVGEYVTRQGGINHYKFTEYHDPDGTTDYIETDADTVKGVWKIIGGDKICYTYPGNSTFDKTYCFFVYENDGCYYSYALGQMTLNGPMSWDYWTSRAISKGSGNSCSAGVS